MAELSSRKNMSSKSLVHYIKYILSDHYVTFAMEVMLLLFFLDSM